jgi:hypothetical protein
MKERPAGMEPVEVAVTCKGPSRDGLDMVDADASVAPVDGGKSVRIPAFWAGKNVFKFRFAPPRPGAYRWEVKVIRGSAEGLDGQSGVVETGAEPSPLALVRKGRLSGSPDGRTLRHADGTPFLWLADTWWMAFTKRLAWPGEFARLTEDRVRKGFSVIQVVAGPLPDYHAPEQAFDSGQESDAGWPWEKDWVRINPAYFDRVDLGLRHLIENGLMPCIVGMWGYWGLTMGEERARRHWRYLIARYGAWPVTWCAAGEATMPAYHTGFAGDATAYARESEALKAFWSRLTVYIRETDPYRNLVTLHPRAPGGSRRELESGATVDVEMVQTTHMGYSGLHGHLEALDRSLRTEPRVPVFVAEANYEGIMGSSWQDIQRFLFWTALTMGCCGHTYGAQGLWGMHARNNPHRGCTGDWGRGCWEDAMHYAGSAQVGLGARFLSGYPWWRCRPLREPAADALNRPWTFGMGIPGELAIYYLPANTNDPRHLGMVGAGWMGNCLPVVIPEGRHYTAFFFDPIEGGRRPIGPIVPDADGNWTPPRKPSSEDWVLVLELTPDVSAKIRAGLAKA